MVEKSVRGRYCAGNWKDIEAFNLLLQDMAEFELIEFQRAAIDVAIKRCAKIAATNLVVAYSFFPELLPVIKAALPDCRVHVRTHNAEAYQHWHRAEIGSKPAYEKLRMIYAALRLAWRDSLCKRNTDGLLGISQWDNQNYWKFLPGKAEVHYVPYSCPWPRLRPKVTPLPWGQRKNEIVCLAGGRDAIGCTMIQGFNDLADTLGAEAIGKDWSFALSPGIGPSRAEDQLSARVERMATLDEPWDLLCSVRALAVLTPLGFGFKTTIADALAAGCHVLVHPALTKRLPCDIRACCIEYDPDNPLEPKILGGILEKEPRCRQINESLKGQALITLKRAFELH